MTNPTSLVQLDANRDGGTRLRRRWKPADPAAAILGVHGVNEHSGRYEQFGTHLASAGYDTEMFDLRGHGQSSGRRSYVDSYDSFYDDIEDLLAERRLLGVPVVLFGHSLGGLIVSSYLLNGRPEPDLVILSAPAFGTGHNWFDRLFAKTMNKVAPKLLVSRSTDASVLSRDETIQTEWNEDPLVIEGITGGLAASSLAAMEFVSAKALQLTLPTYVLHGEADTLVPPAASQPLQSLPCVTYRLWPDMRHECLNEVGRQRALDELTTWLRAQIRAVEPG